MVKVDNNMEIKYSPLVGDPDGYKYILDEDYVYYSRTFNRTKTLKKGMKSDGASGVSDLGAEETGWRKWWSAGVRWIVKSWLKKYITLQWGKVTAAWFAHDGFCVDPYWDDGTPVSNFIASTVFACILYTDGYKARSIPYWWATFLFGGKKIKEQVGWFWIPEEDKETV